MWERVRPTYLYYRVECISLAWLREQNVKYILLDVDNTIAVWNREDIETAVSVWLEGVLSAGIKVILISNSGATRLKRLSSKYGIGYISWALKPFSRSFERALNKLGATRYSDVLVIGDQMFTDVLGGNCLGIRTVLVTPRYDKDYIWTKLMRHLERYALHKLKLNKKTSP